MSCATTLQPAFDWIKKGKIGGTNEFPMFAAVYATMTIHTPEDRKERTADLVLYANGRLRLKQEGNQEILSGQLQTWLNNTKDIVVGNVGQPGFNISHDLFPFTPQTTIGVKVTGSGQSAPCFSWVRRPS